MGVVAQTPVGGNKGKMKIIEFERFLAEQKRKKPNSFLDYYCPDCKNAIKLFYESWAGGRHGEAGYKFEFAISDKNFLEDWKIEINEQSNNVFVVKMIHKLGPSVEKIGKSITELLKECRTDSIRMQEEINKRR